MGNLQRQKYKKAAGCLQRVAPMRMQWGYGQPEGRWQQSQLGKQEKLGRGGRIRTLACRNQNPV
ncbi:MAG: hypothetical protein Q4G39_07375, partial [Brachymonas sp.]|nr:hypothetical protein [Brachymonas sp.]